MSDLADHLIFLYGESRGRVVMDHLRQILDRYRPLLHSNHAELSERDSVLITYGDQVQSAGMPPLRVLADFCRKHLTGVVNAVHILPFYPWTSDDGFSVKDYRAVDPALGDWVDIEGLGKNFRLMFDAVINHISSQSEWFQRFLRDDPHFRDYFITVEGEPDLSDVARPRTLPLLTQVHTTRGRKSVWTTFSDDQIDLNYRHPEVLLEIVDLILFYVTRGAEFIRLDAIAYLWKEIGTVCIHLPQTHRLIQLLRAVLNEVAPHVLLITETNVPHADNLSYFGDGHNEAQLVYNFALPPLVLHTLHTGNASALSKWASDLKLPSHHTTFFNFLASHDGIGINPVRDILPESDIETLVQRTMNRGGLVSYKHNPDGSQSPYELNINYFDALSNPKANESIETQVDRFMVSQSIMLSLIGVPGIYFHSLFGSRGWAEGVKETGRNRTINRQKCHQAKLEEEINNSVSLRSRVFKRYRQLLKLRAASAAFHPHGTQQVLDFGNSAFALLRISPDDGGERVLCLHNVSSRSCTVMLNFEIAHDLISNLKFKNHFTLSPYQITWLKLYDSH
ncbi:MAG: sugar phosphorylase [Chloroflexi bacterium]|nr:sugar phosphorylase [Chloroflexota bacterium]